ncbi:MAG: MFS transporter [Ilumatobacter sp.]
MDTQKPLGRRFLTVWVGQTISTIGTTLSGVGVGVYVFIETGSAAWLGVLAALSSLPYLLTSPLLPFTDRFARRTVMIAADAFAAIGPAIAVALALADRLEVWHLVAAGFVGGLGNSLQWPASQAAIPALVAPSELDRANSLSQLGNAGGIVLGPALATPLVARWGIEAVLLVDLATFVVAVATTVSVRFVDAVDDDDVADDRTWAAARTWLGGPGRPLVAVLAIVAMANFLLAFFSVAILVIATDVGGIARAGLVLGVAGAAMIVGSLVSAQRGVPADRVKAMAAGIVTVGLGLLVASLRPSLVLLSIGVFVALGAVPLVNATTSTIFHENVPASMQGRVFGLRSAIGRSFEPIGSLLAGFLIATVAAPAMVADGRLASTVGRVIGTGAERGAALVVAIVGVALVALGYRLASSPIRDHFRRIESGGAVTSDDAEDERDDGRTPQSAAIAVGEDWGGDDRRSLGDQ